MQACAYQAYVATDDETEMFDYHNPLAYEASIHHEPDLPRYVDTLTGPDQAGFHKAMQR